MLESARIQIDEASHQLQHRVDNFDLDPERLSLLEARYDDIMSVARRHRVDASELNELFQSLSEELASLNNDDSNIEALEQQQALALQTYQALANKLSDVRHQAANTLQQKVNEQLQHLSMKGCRFEVALTSWQEPVNKLGNEDIEFLISTQPNKPAQPLAKIASGGELSRISLAIQVIIAQTSAVGCMVFDEVDVGIGGAVAEVVGNLLQALSTNTQVLCVTHLAQVAVKGHQHILVSKLHNEESVSTNLEQLEADEKILEIARMIGGISVNEQTMAHAKAMLNIAH
jgi:DNA repair protein RecN (Recombination protein N)